MMGFKSAFLFFNSGWGTQQYLQNLFKPNTATNMPPEALGINFQSAQYGPPIAVMYGQNKVAGNVISYDGFTATQQTAQGGKGGGNGQPTGYTYTASFLLALCEGTVSSLVNCFDGTTTWTPGETGGPITGNFFATGTAGQAAWSHLSGAAALGYSKTCLYGFVNYPLGSSSSLPNLNFEIAALLQYGGGIVDANPSAIFNDICTDSDHGIGFNLLGSLTQYSNYCVANGIFLSPVYDTQSTAMQALADLLKYTNTEAFFSENQLKLVPRGDTSVTGNGVTFTPNTTIAYEVDYTDIITSNKGDQPITMDRKSPSDCRNIVRMSFKDRSYMYYSNVCLASIDYDILVNGSRAELDESYGAITTAAVAKIVAQNLLQKMFYVRNTYTFKLPWRFCDLEPMDLLKINDPNLGLVSTPVRITSIEEDEAGLLTIVAEEYPQGVGYAVQFDAEANQGTNQDVNVDPGPVQAPYIVRGPGLLIQNTNPEIWCAVTGTNPAWGGAQAYLSYDNVNYHPINQTTRQALYGIIALPVWVATNVQSVGQLIQDSNGNTQRVAAITGDFKTGGSAPAWNSTVGVTTTDNHVTWVCVAVKMAAPAAPVLTDSTLGALAATTYFVKCTWVDQYGRETTAGTEASRAVAINKVLNVAQPASPPANAIGWKVYVSLTTNTETLQSISLPIATTTWQEPITGLVAGAAVPASNTTGLFSLPAGGDPDQVNICRVYLYRGQLLGGNQIDADTFATLAMIDTELVSYQNATLAADGGYDISYIRRGGYNSANVAHISGAPFMRMDSNIIRLPVDPSLIGKQVWFKFKSINIFNKSTRTLASETAYSYIVGTNQEVPDVPTSVSALTATASADIVNLSWINPSDLAVGATSIEYTPTWSPYNPYAVGFILIDNLGNTQQVSAITTGISGAFPIPTFAAIVGNTITEGGVTWKCINIGPITQTNLGTPATPMISVLPGAGPANTYFFKITYIDQYGLESLPSAEVTATITSGQNVQLSLSGPPPAGAVFWRIYANTSTGNEKQMTAYLNLPITQVSQITTSTSINAVAPPTIDSTAHGGFTVLHNVMGTANHYKHQQAGDQEYYYRMRQRGWLAQAGWGPYSAIVSAKNANTVRKNSKLGSANLLLDPNLMRTRFSGDQTFWLYDNVKYVLNMTGNADGTGPGFQVIASAVTSNHATAAEYVHVNAGSTVYVRAKVVAGTATVGNFIIGCEFYDAGFNIVTTSEASIPVANMPGAWTAYGQFFRVPLNQGIYYARYYLRGGTTLNGTVFANVFFMSVQDYALGSTPTTLCSTTMNYTSTTTSITVNWSSFSIRLPDGSTITVGNDNTGACTGLLASHTYFTYLSYDIAKQGGNSGVIFQNGGSGAGTAAGMCYTGVNSAATQAQNNLNQFPMSSGAFQVATPASGAGSGSGGGSAGGTGGCLHGDDWLVVKDYDGQEVRIRARDLRDGFKMLTPDGWRPVSEVRHSEDSDWLKITTSDGQELIRTGAHVLYDLKQNPIHCNDLKPGTILHTQDGRTRVLKLEILEEVATRVSFTVEGHLYFAVAGGVDEHNTNQKP